MKIVKKSTFLLALLCIACLSGCDSAGNNSDGNNGNGNPPFRSITDNPNITGDAWPETGTSEIVITNLNREACGIPAEGDVVIPEFVEQDGQRYRVVGLERAFDYCTNLTSVTIPESVTNIGYSAFSSCTNLTSVTIPKSVSAIGDSAFSECTNLTSVTIPEGITNIELGAFRNCTSLDHITIPESVTSIGSRAFSGCDSLTEIAIPGSVTSIEGYAFACCKQLSSVTISEGVVTIGECAFWECDKLTEAFNKFSQLPNAFSPKWAPLGMVTSVKLSQAKNAPSSISVTASDNVIVVKLRQLLNACRPITPCKIPTFCPKSDKPYNAGWRGRY